MYDSAIREYIAQKGYDVIVDIIKKGVVDGLIKVDINQPIVMLAAINVVAKDVGVVLGGWHMILDTGIVYVRVREL